MANFIKGVELSKLFYQQEVKPILDLGFPELKYSSALFGWGSETLGYDTAQSSDHHWGPRVILFLAEKDFSEFSQKIKDALANKLPYDFMGYSTNFRKAEENGVRVSETISSGPVNHMVDVFTIKSFWDMRLKFDPYQEITMLDWLTFPQQRLLEMTSGEVFHDGLEELNKTREKFQYYPREVWLYMLSAQWSKISEEEAFVGRTGDVGDELGSQVVASRIVKQLMELCFLMEQKYYPYTKWFGTAFSKLDIAPKLAPILTKVLLSSFWKEREEQLTQAYKVVAEKHNSLKITPELSTEVSLYHDRPYLVIHADTFAGAIKETIENEALKNTKTKIGSIDQFIDNTSIVSNATLFRKVLLLLKD